ncbi:MAG: ATP-binding protein [Bacteroidia bacterium]
MNKLIEKHHKKLSSISLDFIRGIMDEIHWNARLIGIKGARGVGKTTLLLQYIKQHFTDSTEALYVNLDDIWFSHNRLVDLADNFVKRGGTHLFLDEVHKYTDWSQEVKNIYDDYPELHIVFTGSSLLEILDARADLSRRAVVYHMQGLSFREFLNFNLNTEFRVFKLEEIQHNHIQLSNEILKTIKPLKYFDTYLQKGYYPFFKEVPELYHARLEEILNMIIYIELPLLRHVDIHFATKLKQLLMVISESAPFIPNIKKISEKIGINRNTLISYLHYLEECGIILNLYRSNKGISRMQKPDKIFLENTNIAYTVNTAVPDVGNLRETFFFNQLKFQHNLTFPVEVDFMVDDTWFFEIGDKNKKQDQVIKLPREKTFLAVDNIEYGHKNQIPLWMFGFLY